jgi:hypothetical protein
MGVRELKREQGQCAAQTAVPKAASHASLMPLGPSPLHLLTCHSRQAGAMRLLRSAAVSRPGAQPPARPSTISRTQSRLATTPSATRYS